MTLFLIDSNTIADFVSRQENTLRQVKQAKTQGDTLGLCRPIHYEVLRGFLWRTAFAKRARFESSIGFIFDWIELADEDWVQAAQFYATTRSAGKHLADTDLLLAALAYRLSVPIVSNDRDFDALPVLRVSWHTQQ